MKKLIVALILLLSPLSAAAFTCTIPTGYSALTGTWNPSDKSASLTLTNGNLTGTATNFWHAARSTVSKSSGKWYWEYKIDTLAVAYMNGIALSTTELDNAANFASNTSGTLRIYIDNGTKSQGGGTAPAYGNSYTAGDTVSAALDMDNGKVFFAKNCTWQASGDPEAGTNAAYTGLSGTYFAFMGIGGAGDQITATFSGAVAALFGGLWQFWHF